MASWDSWRKASMRWCSATSSRCWLDSNRRLSIDDRTGRSASTAAVLGTSAEVLASMTGRAEDLSEPPLEGFSPKIQAKCCRVVRTRCHEVPKTAPWQWATLKMARMHCKFFAVSRTGPCCRPVSIF